MGGGHSQVEANITSPTSPPYVAKQLMALFHSSALLDTGGAVLIQFQKYVQNRTVAIGSESF